jgi:hypothetical protein
MIRRRQFQEVVDDYQPLSFEAFDPEDPRFTVPMQYVLKNGDRLWAAIEAASR